MPGAGKSTIVSKLKEGGYETFSLGDGVRAEAKRLDLEPTGENLGKLMLNLREKNGPGAIALHLILYLAHSAAIDLVIEERPPLAHAEGITYPDPVNAYVVVIFKIVPGILFLIHFLPNKRV